MKILLSREPLKEKLDISSSGLSAKQVQHSELLLVLCPFRLSLLVVLGLLVQALDAIMFPG